MELHRNARTAQQAPACASPWRQVDQYYVGVLAEAIEEDLLPVGRHVKALRRESRSHVRQSAQAAGRKVEQPEILLPHAASLFPNDDECLAVRQKAITIPGAPDRNVGQGVRLFVGSHGFGLA